MAVMALKYFKKAFFIVDYVKVVYKGANAILVVVNYKCQDKLQHAKIMTLLKNSY